MGSKEYWDMVTTAARWLVEATEYNTDEWADELPEALDQVVRWNTRETDWHLDVLKHAKSKRTTEQVYNHIVWRGGDLGDWRVTVQATAWLTMLWDIEAEAYKLAEARAESTTGE